jgi:hypothetical protein
MSKVISKDNMIKIYAVKFINSGYNYEVYSEELDMYICDLPQSFPLIISEDELEYYDKFGDGIAELKLVGFRVKDNVKDLLTEGE